MSLEYQRDTCTFRIALIIGGRTTCLKECLQPLVFKYLSTHPTHWIDIHIAEGSGLIDETFALNLGPTLATYTSESFAETINVDELPSKYARKHESTNIYNTLSMFYHNAKAWRQATEYGVIYDAWIKFRPDIVAYSLPEIGDIIKTGNAIYTPSLFTWMGVNDQVAIGTMDLAASYFGIYEKIEFYYTTDQTFLFHPESILMYHLRICGLSHKTFDYMYSLHPGRWS